MNRFIFIIVFSAVVLTNCEEEKENSLKGQKEITRKQMVEAAPMHTLRAEAVNLDKPLSGVHDLLYHGGHLYLSEYSGGDSLVAVIDPHRQEVKQSLFKTGDGPNELSFVDNMIIQQDTLIFFDPYKYKVYLKPVEKGEPLNWPDERTEIVNIKGILPSNVIYINGKLFGTFYVAEEKARFAELDVETGNLAGYFGELPHYPELAKVDERIHNMINTVKPITKPNGSRFALAYDYQDLVEIYDSNGGLLHTVRGPDFFYPSFNISVRKGGGFTNAPIKGETRIAYQTARATEDELWLLYSGKIMYPLEKDNGADESNLCSEIFVYDWEGNFLRSYQLDIPIYNFCIGPEKEWIYGISKVNDTQLMRFSLQEKIGSSNFPSSTF